MWVVAGHRLKSCWWTRGASFWNGSTFGTIMLASVYKTREEAETALDNARRSEYSFKYDPWVTEHVCSTQG